ncbi:MAG: carbon-nitrogen hydrolase family protein [Negativicutes bacterium]|nr:carbon-nitrogen hydrolase family protein [Negativicutes bacterium]
MQPATAKLRAAAVQMASGSDLDENMAVAEQLVAEAAARGAQLVVLPEYWPFIGERAGDILLHREAFGNGRLQFFLRSLAQRHQVCLVGGTIPLCADDHHKFRNSMLVFAPDGSLLGRYDKVHLFSYSKGRESYNEGRYIEPGDWTELVFAPWGRMGLSVCYDLRFPEFFRAMSFPELIVCAAAFTFETGQAHWQLLLRARAVENQCWLVAAGQGGQHANGRRTWGQSMIVDPWGEIRAVVESGPGVAAADIDFGYLADIRQKLPAYRHRVM